MAARVHAPTAPGPQYRLDLNREESPLTGNIATAVVLGMLSPDIDDCGVTGATVGDTLPVKRRTVYYPGLLAEIARDGITVPIVIQRDENGAPWLVDGHHRVAAAVALGLPTVPWTDVDTD